MLASNVDLCDTDAAYLAGIIDADGCVSITAKSTGLSRGEYHPRLVYGLRIQMCNQDIIKWIQSVTGVGVIYPYVPKNTKHKPSWAWNAYTQVGAEVLKETIPYMRVKKRQAELYIELAKLRAKSRVSKPYDLSRQYAIAEEASQLNKRGLDATYI
jgi:hypothetical protein